MMAVPSSRMPKKPSLPTGEYSVPSITRAPVGLPVVMS